MLNRAFLFVPLCTAALLSACGGRVQDESPLPDDGNPPHACPPPGCPSSPEGGEAPPPVEAGGGGPPAMETGSGSVPQEAGPETGSILKDAAPETATAAKEAGPDTGVPEESGSPPPGRPEGPCPPPATIVADAPCQAGPQTCAGHPTFCDGATFYDAFVCANDASSGLWLWQPLAVTVCPDAGAPGAEADF